MQTHPQNRTIALVIAAVAVVTARIRHSGNEYVILGAQMKDVKIKRLAHLTGHSGAVYTLTALHNQAKVISAGSDRMVALWDTGGNETGTQLVAAHNVVYSLFHEKENNLLLAGQSAGGIHVIDLNESREIRLLQYHTAPVFVIEVSYKHNLMFSGDGSGTIHVSQLSDFTPLTKFNIGTGKVRAIVVDDQNNRLLAGSSDGSVYVINLPDFKLLHNFEAHQKGFSVNTLCLLPGTDYLLSGSRDAHLNVYDIKNNFRLMQSIPAHNYAIYTIAVHPEGNYFATASRDKTVKIWSADTMEVLERIDKDKYNGHTASVNKLVWHEDGKLITASDDRSVMIWQVEVAES